MKNVAQECDGGGFSNVDVDPKRARSRLHRLSNLIDIELSLDGLAVMETSPVSRSHRWNLCEGVEVGYAGSADSIGCVPSFESAHEPASAECLGTLHKRSREGFNVFVLERESA